MYKRISNIIDMKIKFDVILEVCKGRRHQKTIVTIKIIMLKQRKIAQKKYK